MFTIHMLTINHTIDCNILNYLGQKQRRTGASNKLRPALSNGKAADTPRARSVLATTTMLDFSSVITASHALPRLFIEPTCTLHLVHFDIHTRALVAQAFLLLCAWQFGGPHYRIWQVDRVVGEKVGRVESCQC